MDQPAGGARRRLGIPAFRLDGYEIFGEIGRGGSGVVYRAHEEAFDRPVAIKVLYAAVDDVVRARFQRERRSMGAVSGHPNIVTVHNSGVDEWGRAWLCLELLAHGSLADLVDGGSGLGWERATEIGVKLAGALETAHRAGILHRDVKPENVLVSDYGEPKLSDFGIARLIGTADTRSGFLHVTPLHAAPELLDGERASAASDVYSLGSTVFTLLAGAPAFQRTEEDPLPALLLRIQSEPLPDLRRVGVPAPVCAVVEAAMAKDPRRRPPSAARFGDDLRQAQRELGLAPTGMRIVIDDHATLRSTTGGEPPAPPPEPVAHRQPRRRRRRVVAGSAVVAVALAVAVAAALLPRPSQPLTLTLQPVLDRHGVEVTARWELHGDDGDRFRASLRVFNPSGATVRDVVVDEVIPTSLAARVADVAFDPPPEEVRHPGPAVRYRFPELDAGESRELSYAVAVAPQGRRQDRLDAWADERRRLVDARFLPIGVWRVPAPEMAKWRARGVNTVVDVPAGHDLEGWTVEARRLGLRMVRQPRPDPAADAAEQLLLAWSLPSQPEEQGIPAERVRSIFDGLKAAQASRPVHLNLSGSALLAADGPCDDACYRAYIAASDWTSVEIHPVTMWNRPDQLRWIGDAVDRLQALAPGRRPFAFVETSDQNLPFTPPDHRGVTPEELRAEIWVAVLSGARGIWFHPHSFDPPTFDATPDPVVAEMMAQNRRLADLAPPILADVDPPPLRVEAPDPLRVSWRATPTGTWVFALNLSAQPVAGAVLRITGSTATSATVEGEGRSVGISAAQLSDSFGPYEVHVYRLDP